MPVLQGSAFGLRGPGGFVGGAGGLPKWPPAQRDGRPGPASWRRGGQPGQGGWRGGRPLQAEVITASKRNPRHALNAGLPAEKCECVCVYASL